MSEFVYSELVHDDLEWFSWSGIATIRARCEKKALAEGIKGGIKLFFRQQELFSECLRCKPTMRDRQAKWKAKQAPAADPLREALEAIAAGHNDPRTLAIEVLEKAR